MHGRRIARAIALAAITLAAAWAAVLILIGGFDVQIGGWNLSSHQPLRPILWGTLPLAVFVWANGVRRTADAWTRFIERLNHPLVAGALTLTALGVGTTYSTTVANASDPYGYVSQADLWLRGDLTIEQPWAEQAPWPRAAWTFAPLGYRPIAELGNPDLVPVYSPGLPLMMAAAKAIGGHCGVFLVVPISGAVLVLATWGIGRRLGSSGAGLIAAWFVLASPVFLYMMALPMTDVPVAASWAVVFLLALAGTDRQAIFAGLLAALAILVRPNLVWLVVFPALLLGPVRRLVVFAGFVVGAIIAVAVAYARLYGSPFQSGYGDIGHLFGWAHVWPNIVQYGQWLIETQSPLVLAGFAALAWPVAAIWPGARSRRAVRLMGAFVAALFVYYCFYLPFDAWWFLRFLLSAWPFIMVGLALVLIAAARRFAAAGVVVVSWLVVVLGVYTFDVARARGAFDLRHADRAYVAAAQAVRSLTPDTSVVVSVLHSGSLRYYGGRTTLRFELLDPAWLDRAVAWLAERGRPVYALLERDEVEPFKTHFASQSAIRRLDDRPILLHRESGLALYALSGEAPAETRLMQVDAAALRCVPPVPGIH